MANEKRERERPKMQQSIVIVVTHESFFLAMLDKPYNGALHRSIKLAG